MNMNKKFDRFKQWTSERMGGEPKTDVSEDFKALELEMDLRQQGLDKMQRSMNAYVKSISKRSEIETKEKILPIAHMGGTMIAHGGDFEPDSEFGQCLNLLGRTEERLARNQENYIESASASWLDSLERSLVQMKEYQAARKKLEQRRLAYDTSLAKLQKAKREDFRAEEELRSQKAKYEDAEDEVHRRMGDIRDNDPQNVMDLSSFLDAQLEYHEKCRAALVQLQAEWPASTQAAPSRRPNPRSRSSTIRSYTQPEPEPEPVPEVRPTIRSNTSRTISATTLRPGINRSTTYDAPAQPRRDMSPAQSVPLARVPSDSLMIKTARANLRNNQEADVFADDSLADQGYDDRASSPATSNGSSSAMLGGRRAPPPPPPSRAKKPPPPVPQKRASVIY